MTIAVFTEGYYLEVNVTQSFDTYCSAFLLSQIY